MGESHEVALLLRWCDLTVAGLAEFREQIDALNVYPVPDGDTGTNLYLTFEAARQAVMEAKTDSLVSALTVFAKGALLGARGNSGVILSQLLRAGADQLLRGDPSKPGQLLADTLTLASDAAYAAVARPVEGTMLTVARAAARAAVDAVPHGPADPAQQMGFVVTAAADAAHTALDETPEQLETLRRAGVVDAGGMGLCVMFDAAQYALTGTRPPPSQQSQHIASQRPTGTSDAPIGIGPAETSPAGPAFEVMYLLHAPELRIAGLKERLEPLGDSLVVVGGDELWNVHIHVDDVGAAIEAGIAAGRPHRIRVTHFDERAAQQPAGHCEERATAVVAVAAGEGLAELFRAAGAEVVLAAPGHACSAEELAKAIRSTGSEHVVVLPNDHTTMRAAVDAATAVRPQGIRVAVIPSRAQVQGLAAIAVHEATRSFDDDLVQMTAAAGHARHGAVTVAFTDALTTAGPCSQGDCLGIVEGDFVFVGDDLGVIAEQVIDRLMSHGGELVTMVRGTESSDDFVRRLESHIEQTHAGAEVLVYDGGQSRYPLLIGVE